MSKTIYLLRHFHVKDTQKGRLSAREFDTWVDAYDDMELKYLDIELPTFDLCLVSPQNRAIRSAHHLNLKYRIEPRLREVELKLFWQSQRKLSTNFWLTLSRLRWLLNIGKCESRKDSYARAREIIKELQKSDAQTILILSHGFFIKILAQELYEEGYRGTMDFKPQNGKVYSLHLKNFCIHG